MSGPHSHGCEAPKREPPARNRHNRFLAFIAAVLTAMPASLATAQITTNMARSGANVTHAPPLPPSLRDAADFKLPKLQSQSEFPLSDGGRRGAFLLKSVRLSSNHIISDLEIADVVGRYTNRLISLADVAALRDEVSKIIIAKGFITSGAVIGDQDIRNGVLTLSVVEGRLVDVRVSGLTYLNSDYIKSRLHVSPGRALDASELKNAFQLLLQDRNISTLNAQLLPGREIGESTLSIEAKERPRSSFWTVLASDRSPSVGDVRAGLGARLSSVLLSGDEVSPEFGVTEGLKEARLSYSAPITSNNTTIAAIMQVSDSKILDKPFNALDATSRSVYTNLSLTAPIWVKPGQSVTSRVSVDHIRLKTELLNTPFSFSAGSVNGITDYSVARASITYSYFSNWRAYNVSASVSRGLTGKRLALGVSKSFTYFDMSGEAVHKMTPSDQRLILRGQIRLTDDKLYASEMLSIGGADTVRGYRQNAALGNSGYWASFEYQIPLNDLIKLRTPDASPFAARTFRVGVTADIGHLDKDRTPIARSSLRDISSIGAHLFWAPKPDVAVDVYAAHGFRKLSHNSNFQDDGLSFSVVKRF